MRTSTVCLGALACASVAHGFTAPASLRALSAPIKLRNHVCDDRSTLRMAAEEGGANQKFATLAAGVALAVSSFAGSGPAFAVSGGVADFVDVGGQDLSGQNLSKKDFSSANARGTKFQKAKLKGARFFKSDLKDADFTGADLSNASLENAKLDNVVLTNAILKGAYTDQSLGNVKDISGADFSDAQIRPDIAQKLCTRPDATGTNPKTQADTRESLGCP